MFTKEICSIVALNQRQEIEKKEEGIPREIAETIDFRVPHATILSGIRRSGKSTLLKQLMKKVKDYYYCNFEDPRLAGFTLADFERLDAVFQEQWGEKKYYFFDEIQNISGWERYVRFLLDKGKKCIITGSNASLLSKELGTKLTGRHITYEVFPFSYTEMLVLKQKNATHGTFEEYLSKGGFPEFLLY